MIFTDQSAFICFICVLCVQILHTMKSGKRSILLSVLFFSIAIWTNAERRPVIGISDTYKDGTTTVPRSYVNAVLSNGGIPVVVPLMNDDHELIELLNSLDGIIFTGGEDYDPAYYNERPIPQMGTINAPRDKFDIKLLQLAAERGIPVLGICRGAQLINIVFGGSLYQDLPAQYHDNSIRHRQRQASTEASHAVIVEENTVFADIVKDRMLMVNSAHHQAVKDVARGFRVAGKSPDKVVEVIEKMDENHWILGVQFHPEMRVTSDMAMRRIFQRFIAEAGSLENHFRTVKPLIAARPQTARELSQEPQTNNLPAAAPSTQIIYKNIVDTQYVYKMIHDTLHVSVPPDTVYISVTETKIVHTPADTVYISVPETKIVQLPADTIYISVPETKIVQIPADTVYISVPETKTAQLPADTAIIISDSGIAQLSMLHSHTDTLIYTPGEIETPATKKSDSSKMKRQEKAKVNKEKKEAEAKTMQQRKEFIESERQKIEQKKKEKKEQEDREKFEKKVAKEAEKQLKQQQKNE